LAPAAPLFGELPVPPVAVDPAVPTSGVYWVVAEVWAIAAAGRTSIPAMKQIARSLLVPLRLIPLLLPMG
jgi:hypothetical protein